MLWLPDCEMSTTCGERGPVLRRAHLPLILPSQWNQLVACRYAERLLTLRQMAGEVSTARCLRERSSGLVVRAMSIRTDARHSSTRLALDFSTRGPGPLFMNLARRRAGSAMLCSGEGDESEREISCGDFGLYRLPRVGRGFRLLASPGRVGVGLLADPPQDTPAVVYREPGCGLEIR
jgi:hypothetical protein